MRIVFGIFHVFECAFAEGDMDVLVSATMDIHLDLHGLGKHPAHFGACNLVCWIILGFLQKELGHASPNRQSCLLYLFSCLYVICQNRSQLRSKVVKPHTEVQEQYSIFSVPKSPASAA